MHRWFPRLRAVLVAGLLLLAAPVASSAPSQASEVKSALGTRIEVHLHDADAQEVLQQVLSDPGFWSDANIKQYPGDEYDEIRMKKLPPGYFPMITGEGGRDFDHDVVSHIVFKRQDDLTRYMNGAKVVEYLGHGVDPAVGAEYSDAFFYLDTGFFYAWYVQRMYREKRGDVTVLWFEKLRPEYVDEATWAAYDERITELKEGVDRRWAFAAVHEVSDIYGMFVVTEGTDHDTRITFVSRVVFGEDTGWLAQFGSKLPGVVKSAIKNGFDASVAITNDEQDKREGAAASAD